MSEKFSTYVMEPGSNYEFNGEVHCWYYEPIYFKVKEQKSIGRMYEIAFVKFAKYITSSVRPFKKSDWKYINRIDFHLVEDKPAIKIERKKTVPTLEFTDLFGEEKQILSNGKVRIKPIPKGETQ